MMLAVTVVSRRSSRRPLHQRAQRHGDEQPEHDRNQRQPKVNQRQLPGVVEVRQQVSHAQPPRVARSCPAGPAVASRAPPVHPRPARRRCTCPSPSTATPRPDGDDSAASSAWRSVPSGWNSDPPAIVLSYNDFPSRWRRTPSASIQPYGEPSGLMTSAQSPSPRFRPSISSSETRRMSCSGRPVAWKNCSPAVAAVGPDEAGDEVVGRVRQQPRRLVVLLQRAAGAEHGDLVAELDGLVDVMGDEDDGLVQFALQTQHFGLQLVADHRVDRAERLVHQQDRRVGGQRPGHADALLLTAGQLRRIAVGQLRVQPDPLEHAQRGLACRPPGLALEHRHRGDVVDHPLMRHQAGALDDVTDAQAQLDRVDLGDVLAVDGQRARRRVDHPVDHPHRGGLAAAGRPDEHRERAVGHVERQLVDRDGAVGILLGDVVEADHALILQAACRSRWPAPISGPPRPGRCRCFRTRRC